ncbi:hypothetical protein NFI96_032220 [Prochilodus magdalenae]|nr:hypothetical protein NFI96_032220 [Prochilodus magdalenae]
MQRLLTIAAISGFSPFMELLRRCASHSVTASPSQRGSVVVLGLSWSRAPHLYDCSITEEGCAALVSALRSNPSHLRELNLRANNPGESGVKLLSDLLEDPHCKLEKLDLYRCSITEEGCAALVSALKSNPSNLRELDLSSNNPGESGVKMLSDLLEDPHFKLETLQLWGCNLTERSCAVLSPALSSPSSSLRELNLSNNELQDRGVKLLSDGLKNPHCKLEKLGPTRELSRFGKLVSPIQKIPLGCKSPLVRHLVLFRRVVYKDGADTLDVTFKLRVDGFDYPVFISSDTDIRCFGCGLVGHLVHICPARRNEAGTSEGAGGPEPEAAEPATTAPPEAGGSAPREPAVNVKVAPLEEGPVLPASAAGELTEALGHVEHADAVEA